jgi:ArsR family transcriptional regulator, arsenate/arsenite/antimonite-responsive transcriptional repressor
MLTAKEIGNVRKRLRENSEERMPFVLQALGDSTRLKIVRLLVQHKDLCVTDIANILKVSLPAISYQMRMLEVVGVVRKERMGKMICYGLKKEDPLVKRILKVVQ